MRCHFLYASLQVDEWVSERPGWVISHIEEVVVDVAEHDPVPGRTYFPLPAYLALKRAIINVRSEDDQSLKSVQGYIYVFTLLKSTYKSFSGLPDSVRTFSGHYPLLNF